MTKDEKSANTIKVSVYFHTSGYGIKLHPKVAFKEGWVSMPTNHKHGIRASDVKPIYFGKAQGPLNEAIKKCLKANKIKFIEQGKETEYKKYQQMQEKKDFYDEEAGI